MTKHQNPTSGGRSGVFNEKKEGEAEPNLRDIKRGDLESIPRLMKLFDQAVTCGLIRDGHMERLNFAAAAEHARVRGSSNPCGLFFHLVSKKLWNYITDGDEDAVRRKLNAYLHGEPLDEERRSGGDEWDTTFEPVGVSFESLTGLDEV